MTLKTDELGEFMIHLSTGIRAPDRILEREAS